MPRLAPGTRRKSMRRRMSIARGYISKKRNIGKASEVIKEKHNNPVTNINISPELPHSESNTTSIPELPVSMANMNGLNQLTPLTSNINYFPEAVPSTSNVLFIPEADSSNNLMDDIQKVPSSDNFELTGRRIVNINFFFQQLINFKHLELFSCTSEHLRIVGEQRLGLKSKIIVSCSMCYSKKIIETDNDQNSMDINKSSVLGCISTGGGYSSLRELLSTCDIPSMGPHLFNKTEDTLSSHIHDEAWKLMEYAGKEEARLAIEEGNVDSDNIPLITVIADGAWSKRSYKVNFNALSGVGVIVGKRTGKLLFLGIRNKYCCVCSRAKSKNSEPSHHKCFKNWNKPSTGMEADIIVEGFMRSIEMHYVKYAYLVGDGDSSVTKKLLEARPYGNRLIEKIECRNHLLRNYCTNLRGLLKNKFSSSKKVVVSMNQRNALNDAITRLRTGVQCAVKFVNEKCTDFSHAEKMQHLRKDILNGPSHVFGEHSHCSKYFCVGPKTSENEIKWITDMKNSGLYQDIMVVVGRVARHAESLILNMDNNAAECYNSVLAKFIGGKRINFSARRSYQTRCEAALISYNSNPGQLSAIIHKSVTNTSPGEHTKKYINSLTRAYNSRNCRKELFPKKFKKKKNSIAPADMEYGLVDDGETLSSEEIKVKETEFLASLKKSEDELNQIQIDTIGQSDNLLWRQERFNRLTASNFGSVCKMKKSTHCRNLVKNLLYSNFRGNSSTRWGQDHEIVAVTEFEENYQMEVQKCGIFIDKIFYFLGASPDGLIGEDGIVEIKCPHKASSSTVLEAIKNKTIKFLENDKGKIKLKRRDNYYFQIQGQLKITNRKYCYFIVWTPTELIVEKIVRDEKFWQDYMESQLTEFFYKCLLPELVNPQFPKKLPIKDLRQLPQ